MFVCKTQVRRRSAVGDLRWNFAWSEMLRLPINSIWSQPFHSTFHEICRFLFARWQHHQLVMGAHVIPQLHHKADDRIDRAPKTRQKRSHHFHIGTRHGYNLVGWFGITQHRHFDFRWKVRMSMTSSILDSFDKMFKQGKYSIQEVRPWNCGLSLSEQTNWENMWHCAALACFFVLFPQKKIGAWKQGIPVSQ